MRGHGAGYRGSEDTGSATGAVRTQGLLENTGPDTGAVRGPGAGHRGCERTRGRIQGPFGPSTVGVYSGVGYRSGY